MGPSSGMADPASPEATFLTATRNLLVALLGSNVFALFMAGLFECLSLRGVINLGLARVVLAFVWIIGVIGIVISERIWGRGSRDRLLWGLRAAVILALMLYGIHVGVSRVIRVTNVPTQSGPTAPTVIKQHATDSTCTNVVAGRNANINCQER
jgi:hypothetical protein